MRVGAVTGVHYVTGFHRSTHVILIISMNRYFSRGKLIVAHMVKKNSMFMEPYSSSCGKKGSLMATKRNDIIQISGKFQSNYFIIEPVTSSLSSHKLFPNMHFSIIFLIFVPAFYVLYVRPNLTLVNHLWKFLPVFEQNAIGNVVKTVVLPSDVPILIMNINWRKQKRTEFHGTVTFTGTKSSGSLRYIYRKTGQIWII
jgi:hypothetical protein